MQKPNEEQTGAIIHEGGVLLKAGAGSGKTFVLVEHVIHIIKQFNQKHQGLELNDYRLKLREFLSGVVVVTFTKKAAGELSLRLKTRIEEEHNNATSLETIYWKVIQEVYLTMTVGTIHSFCFKLLSQGFILDVDPDLNIISDVEFRDKIDNVFDRWFKQWKKTNK